MNGIAYELSELLATMESLHRQYAHAKREMQDDESLRELVKEMDSALAQLVKLTRPTR